jgi:enoyl-CoA hydratase
MSEGSIAYEKDATTHIARITIDNPAKRNAYDLELRDAMFDAMVDAAEDDAVKVVLLRGTGGDLSAGADLGGAYAWYETPGDTRRPSQRRRLTVDRQRQHLYHLWTGYPKATVVQLEGVALGGGLELALAGDVTVAGRTARIGMPAARFLGPVLGNLHLFFHRMGPVLTRRMLLTGDLIKMAEIAHLGLFTEVVDDTDVATVAEGYAAKIAKMPADGIVLAKEAYRLVESLNGLAGAEVTAYLFHAMGTNLRFDEDEFNFVKTRAEVGVSEAFRQRDRHFTIEN